MHLHTRSSTWTRLLEGLLTMLIAAGLSLAFAGCDGGGSNGGGNGGGGNGDGNGGGGGLTAPAAPSGLTTDAGDGEVALSWDAVSEADAYNVYRDTAPTDSASGSPLNTDITEASYTDNSAENGTTYYYRVTAVASEGGETAESDGSGEAQGTPFAPPTGLEGTSGDAQIELSWNAAEGAETYNVYRSTASTGGAEGDPLTSGVAETAYTDTTAENGTKYFYRVTSVNPEDEESAASNEIEKTPFDDPPDRP